LAGAVERYLKGYLGPARAGLCKRIHNLFHPAGCRLCTKTPASNRSRTLRRPDSAILGNNTIRGGDLTDVGGRLRSAPGKTAKMVSLILSTGALQRRRAPTPDHARPSLSTHHGSRITTPFQLLTAPLFRFLQINYQLPNYQPLPVRPPNGPQGRRLLRCCQ